MQSSVVTISQNCGTCYIPTTTSVSSTDCPGLRGGRIYVLKNCTKWSVADKRFTVTQALAYASSAGVPVTRPTMIHWCVTHSIGKQIGNKYGHWYIDPKKLRKLLQED